METGPNLTAPDASVLDMDGATVVPGLIDGHVHITALTADLGALPTLSPSYVTAHSARIMGTCSTGASPQSVTPEPVPE